MTEGALAMTEGALAMTEGALAMTEGALATTDCAKRVRVRTAPCGKARVAAEPE